jgi:hypothetical protein
MRIVEMTFLVIVEDFVGLAYAFELGISSIALILWYLIWVML